MTGSLPPSCGASTKKRNASVTGNFLKQTASYRPDAPDLGALWLPRRRLHSVSRPGKVGVEGNFSRWAAARCVCVCGGRCSFSWRTGSPQLIRIQALPLGNSKSCWRRWLSSHTHPAPASPLSLLSHSSRSLCRLQTTPFPPGCPFFWKPSLLPCREESAGSRNPA